MSRLIPFDLTVIYSIFHLLKVVVIITVIKICIQELVLMHCCSGINCGLCLDSLDGANVGADVVVSFSVSYNKSVFIYLFTSVPRVCACSLLRKLNSLHCVGKHVPIYFVT